MLLHHQSMNIDMLNLKQYYKQLLQTMVSMYIVDFEWREKDTLTSKYGSSYNSRTLRLLYTVQYRNRLACGVG